MSVHMAFLIPLRHLLANQSKIPLVFFAFASFPYPTSGWVNFNGGDVISERLTSFGVTQEQHPPLQHPSALHPWGDCCPLSTSRVSLLCCAQPNFSTLVRVKLCHLWDFNHYSLQCQLFSKETNRLYKGENEEEHPAFDFIDIYECKQLQGPLLSENVICLLFSIHKISDFVNILYQFLSSGVEN